MPEDIKIWKDGCYLVTQPESTSYHFYLSYLWFCLLVKKKREEKKKKNPSNTDHVCFSDAMCSQKVVLKERYPEAAL